jgi:dihydroneopterin aldolase
MDRVFLHGLEIETYIGIYDWEQERKQKVIIDLDMASDVARAAKTERIEDALDYKAVAKRLVSFVSGRRFQLVETMAEAIATILRDEFRIPWVRVKVNKRGAITGAGDVGVIIERGEN